jgi:undecaprenyl-diphosphatase
VNWFDANLVHLINGLAHRSVTVDAWMAFLSYDGFQKGGIVVFLLWWAWFLPEKEGTERNRETLLCVMLAAPFALALSRFISYVAPFRERPLRNPALHIRIAYGLNQQTLIHWSSFPSDHAVLFFTLVAGLLLVSQRAGVFASLYVLAFVCFPRVYLGLHFPTDILVGAGLGIAVGYLICLRKIRTTVARPILRWKQAYPGVFYATLFFYTYQLADAYGWARDILGLAYHSVVAVFRKSG